MDLSKYSNISENVQVSGQNIVPYILSLTEYFQENGVDVKPYPKVVLSKDSQYENDMFGKTAFYNPELQEITLYTAGRHLRDVCRSYCHEMVHHSQFLRGDLNESVISKLSDPNYTQNDDNLRELEEEAYLQGNMLMRDWSDKIKSE